MSEKANSREEIETAEERELMGFVEDKPNSPSPSVATTTYGLNGFMSSLEVDGREG